MSPIDKEKLQQRLLKTFFIEFDEHLSGLSHSTTELEQCADHGARTDLLTKIFRAVHSLKGAARSVNAATIESLCHAMEDQLAKQRELNQTDSKALAVQLFELVDQLTIAIQKLKSTTDLVSKTVAPASTPAEIPAPSIVSPIPAESGSATAEPVRTIAPTSNIADAALNQRPLRASDQEYVRVSLRRLNGLEKQTSELTAQLAHLQQLNDELTDICTSIEELKRRHDFIARADLTQSVEKPMLSLHTKLSRHRDVLQRVGEDIRHEIHGARLIAFHEVCDGYERMLRDLAFATGKQVRLVITGDPVDLDRAVAEALRDPLRQILRNAIDHGIEPTAERALKNKPVIATITVAATLVGSLIAITVQDDGRGLDESAVRASLSARGITLPENQTNFATGITDHDRFQLLQALFLPGVSTSKTVSAISGRGVGLDIVKSRIESIHGTVVAQSEPGQGMLFTLKVPQTLSSLHALLVRDEQQIFACPIAHVDRIVNLAHQNAAIFASRAVSLTEALGIDSQRTHKHRNNQNKMGSGIAMIIGREAQAVAFSVDEVLGEQLIVVKSLESSGRVHDIQELTGSTLLASGEIALVINPSFLTRHGAEQAQRQSGNQLTSSPSPMATKRAHILIVDDSATIRQLERSILEDAGYEVSVATQGDEAWKMIHEIDADLLISDIEMPVLNGIELTKALRQSERFKDFPIILLTGLGSDNDKKRGLDAGADAYLEKQRFEQDEMLAVIKQLL